jgi:hypothetical protein
VAILNAFASSIRALWATDMAPLHGVSVNLDAVNIEDLTSATAAVGTSAGLTAGTRAGTQMPAGVAVVNAYKISRRYRGGHPKSYFPAFTNTDISTAQLWVTASVNAFNAGWAAFKTGILALSSGGCTITNQVNVSYFKGFTVITNPVTGRARNLPTPRAVPVVDQIISSACDTVPGSQRRRNRATGS